jgi:signal transduction histidine kinase
VKRWRDLSYRHKVPIALSVVIVVTAALVSLALLAHAWQAAREQFIANGSSLGRALARSLVAPLLHDDPWAAFEILRTPLERDESSRILVVLDGRDRVFAATDPHRLRALTPAKESPLLAPLSDEAPFLENGEWWLLVQPVVAEDGVRLGRLVMAYHRDLVLPRFHEAARRLLLATAAALILLLPIGWYTGNALASPLIRLAACFEAAGKQRLRVEDCPLDDGADEIGLVGRRFHEMIRELEEKHRLEQEMVATQRLAAIGRLTAGIAHEVNNPLGGMLNAINTYRRHGSGEPLAIRTFDLLERGLTQIRDTVGALLVEAKLESHALRRQDVEDVRTLIHAEVERRHLGLAWQVDMPEVMPMPATPVRQILLNLLLNACHAAAHTVTLELHGGEEGLVIEIGNDGRSIPPERMAHLFEPFAGADGQGRGLGLWIVYQLVRQLGGSIQARSHPGQTRFVVKLPTEKAS